MTDVRRGRWSAGLGAALLLAGTGPWTGAAAQGLADYDYENLAFRGLAIETGYILPTTVDPTVTVGARLDLGYLGPGLRIVPRFTYWSSELEDSEVGSLEERLEELIERETGEPLPVPVDLGTVEWSDLVLALDAHFVWSVPFGFLTYAGAGGSAHILNGEGAAIEGTFIEDLLDQVTAGFNVHLGLERRVGSRFRLFGSTRGEVLGDIQYLEFLIGGQIDFGDPAPGELGGG